MTVCTALLAVICGYLIALPAAGQYFAKNTVRWETFDFRVLETEHFDIYCYDALEEHIETAGQLAERWNRRLVSVLNHRLTSRQPIILYATHPHFRQTKTSPADIGEGTGGFTEILRNRVVLPFAGTWGAGTWGAGTWGAGTWGDTDHVLGHERVQAFQFDMTGGETDPERFGNIPGAIRLPLWLVEGMAEYLSIGPHDSHATMFMPDVHARCSCPMFMPDVHARCSCPMFMRDVHARSLDAERDPFACRAQPADPVPALSSRPCPARLHRRPLRRRRHGAGMLLTGCLGAVDSKRGDQQ